MSMMTRRSCMVGLASLMLTPNSAIANGQRYTHPNGVWDASQGVFDWRRIGVDVYGNQPLRIALGLLNIPRTNQAAILRAIEVRPGVWTTPNQGVSTIRRGHQYAAMVSGGVTSSRAWAVPNVRPFPDRSWSSVAVDVWVVYINGQRYVFGRPHGCSNWLILPGTNAPFYCPPPCCG